LSIHHTCRFLRRVYLDTPSLPALNYHICCRVPRYIWMYVRATRGEGGSRGCIQRGATIGENILLRALCHAWCIGTAEKHGQLLFLFCTAEYFIGPRPSRVSVSYPPWKRAYVFRVGFTLGPWATGPHIYIRTVAKMIKEDVYRALGNTREK